jgi:uncharacterized delta-60 repeat protein
MTFWNRCAITVLALATALQAPCSLAADGSFDPNWLGGGRTVFSGDYFNSSNASSVNFMLTQPDGTLLLGGDVSGGWWLGEMTTAGQFVLTFGASDGTGRVTSCHLGNCGMGDLLSLLRQGDGKYVALSEFDVTRTTALGHAFDTAGVAGGSGYLINDFGINDVQGVIAPAVGVAQRADGTLLLSGNGTYSAADSVSRLGVVSLKSDLSIDTSFNAITDGQGVTFAGGALVRADASDFDETAYAVLVQGDGRIVLVGAGLKDISFLGYVQLARLNPNGSLDTSFGAGGTTSLLSTVGNVSYGPLVAKFDRAGRIVVVLQTRDASAVLDAGMLVARFTADGIADSTFGNGGFYYDTAPGLGCSHLAANDFTIDSAGRILVAGYCDASFLVERIRGDQGILDTSFGIAGRSHGSYNDLSTSNTAWAVTLDAGGRPLVGGESALPGALYAALGRLTYDLIFTNNFESAPRGCLPPDCN